MSDQRDMRALQLAVGEWADETFGIEQVQGIVKHLKKKVAKDPL